MWPGLKLGPRIFLISKTKDQARDVPLSALDAIAQRDGLMH